MLIFVWTTTIYTACPMWLILDSKFDQIVQPLPNFLKKIIPPISPGNWTFYVTSSIRILRQVRYLQVTHNPPCRISLRQWQSTPSNRPNNQTHTWIKTDLFPTSWTTESSPVRSSPVWLYPSGEYACTRMPFFLQYSANSDCCRYGWASIWFTAGININFCEKIFETVDVQVRHLADCAHFAVESSFSIAL